MTPAVVMLEKAKIEHQVLVCEHDPSADSFGMADPADAERLTGYVVGGISPLGQRRRLLSARFARLATIA